MAFPRPLHLNTVPTLPGPGLAPYSLPRCFAGSYSKNWEEGPKLPRAYRLIALLSVLGKDLERLIAHRMAWIAIKHKFLHPQQFGALPLRSATDLTAALIHDVEEAWSRGLKASMLTVDVQGAFDAVLRGRLIRRLRDQGWPINVIWWVASFTQGRTAILRLGNHTSQTFQVPAGLPQGYPISPILFMLFIEPIFKQGSLRSRRGRFGYADDICQLVASSSLEENCTALEHCTEELRQWGTREGLTFDSNKTELQHFTPTRKRLLRQMVARGRRERDIWAS